MSQNETAATPKKTLDLKPGSDVVVPLEPKRFRIHSRQVRDVTRAEEGTRWRVVIPPTDPYEEMLKESTWSWALSGPHGEIKAGNYIELHVADNSYEALLFVREVTGGGLRVVEIRKTEFEKQVPAASLALGDFRLGWDRLQKHHVVRAKDNHVMSQGYATQLAAHTAMVELAAARR